MKEFKFWCQKALPLVYDDSLSYYEVLCKVVDYINNLIAEDSGIIEDVQTLKNEVGEVQKWIDNYDTSFAENVIKQHLASMIFVEINDGGYITYNIPHSWNTITFNTTGVDIELPIQPEYGHLVLSY